MRDSLISCLKDFPNSNISEAKYTLIIISNYTESLLQTLSLF